MPRREGEHLLLYLLGDIRVCVVKKEQLAPHYTLCSLNSIPTIAVSAAEQGSV